MNRQQIQETVLDVLGQIAPEADPRSLDPKVSLRDQLDIDSMDFLNFLIALDKQLQVDIPERDYGRLMTLDACVDYLLARQTVNRTGG
ncbi:MAG: phosphopantetheine-binding protein [Pirellulales bacterium]